MGKVWGWESSPTCGLSVLGHDRGGVKPTDEGWATGLFGRRRVLFIFQLPQSSFTGILRKWQARQRPFEFTSSAKGGLLEWLRRRWMWNEAMAVEVSRGTSICMTRCLSALSFSLFLFLSVFKVVMKLPQLIYLLLCFLHNKPCVKLAGALVHTSAYTTTSQRPPQYLVKRKGIFDICMHKPENSRIKCTFKYSSYRCVRGIPSYQQNTNKAKQQKWFNSSVKAKGHIEHI